MRLSGWRGLRGGACLWVKRGFGRGHRTRRIRSHPRPPRSPEVCRLVASLPCVRVGIHPTPAGGSTSTGSIVPCARPNRHQKENTTGHYLFLDVGYRPPVNSRCCHHFSHSTVPVELEHLELDLCLDLRCSIRFVWTGRAENWVLQHYNCNNLFRNYFQFFYTLSCQG